VRGYTTFLLAKDLKIPFNSVKLSNKEEILIFPFGYVTYIPLLIGSSFTDRTSETLIVKELKSLRNSIFSFS
jgi:hypothetical protein